nr:MAG TPA: hypothetical protein [Caudoviricetes sp.]
MHPISGVPATSPFPRQKRCTVSPLLKSATFCRLSLSNPACGAFKLNWLDVRKTTNGSSFSPA